jgi:hypothetical protein
LNLTARNTTSIARAFFWFWLEIIGALQSGWEHVDGIELSEEFVSIAEARIKYWMQPSLAA